ncbi:winged helix-turn-helix transcriptional regulator [Planococcus sp. CPCC 101016]|uniref:winged helix-turn-helix transcriptional regulator n=1 Tax=Planococcus sp. CPCC 101016 TaxID=2599617 RepID=UPI0021BDC9EC|nr:helix-turn-helix domain-containing protein [Planococcus sp. CPCC 101016]
MEWEEERLLFKIAQLYYEQDFTQAEISKELGIYRTTVGRMLKKAKKEGIVKIEVKSKVNEQIDMEEKIRKYFGMKEVVIVPSKKTATHFEVEQLIGKACS